MIDKSFSAQDGSEPDSWNSVLASLRLIFPNGTGALKSSGHERLPFTPTDVFAVAAYLIERGGVYHRIVRKTDGVEDDCASRWNNGRHLILSNVEIAEWRKLGERWRLSLDQGSSADSDAAIPSQQPFEELRSDIQKIWGELIKCEAEDVVRRPFFEAGAGQDERTPPAWWRPAYALLVIADEASSGLGYQIDNEHLAHPVETLLRWAVFSSGKTTTPIDDAFPWHERIEKKTTSFAVKANPHVVRVVPKSRTPAVGNTMRTLTHNLALAPPHGVVDLVWQRELGSFKENREPLNLLLIPLPYKIPARCFEPTPGARQSGTAGDQWSCMFDVHQRWLTLDGSKPPTTGEHLSSTDVIVDFVCGLIDVARADINRVHGLLLPELALNWPIYNALVRKLVTDANDKSLAQQPPLDFIVCGSSSDCGGNHGNYVLVTTFQRNDTGELVATTHSRSKHHRWRLTGSQISDYGLSASLDPQIIWWEAIQIPKREVGLTVFRRDSIFSAMICEDLARSEPCHEPLKSVGPNLVFALLMDGSQLPDRWSARYATSLADDPGCSVLTLTSLGLLERTNCAERYPVTRNIALWKDDTGRLEKIICPPGAHAVLLTLGGETANESTIDGRCSTETASWRYRGHQPISLRGMPDKFDWIVRPPSSAR